MEEIILIMKRTRLKKGKTRYKNAHEGKYLDIFLT
jgi:hypothetical protein